MSSAAPNQLDQPDQLDRLILARWLVPATTAKARDDLAKLAGRADSDGWAADFDARRRRLLAAELLRPKGRATSKTYELTEPGRQEALTFLGLAQLPAKPSWAAIQADHLVPLALGLRPNSDDARRIKKAAALKVALVARGRQLPLAQAATAKNLLATLAWKLIGIESTAPFTAENVIQQLVFDQPPGKALTTDRVTSALAAAAVGARTGNLSELRTAAIRQWLSATRPSSAVATPSAATSSSALPASSANPPPAHAVPPSGQSRPAFDLPAFAQRVLAAARRSASGRFGDNKVFISHVYRGLEVEPTAAGGDLLQFKCRLLEANREGLLRLSRADLVEAMDPDDLRDSATVHDNATFHFIRI